MLNMFLLFLINVCIYGINCRIYCVINIVMMTEFYIYQRS